MPKYFVRFTCVQEGRQVTGNTVVEGPGCLTSLEDAQQNGLAQVVEKAAQAQGKQVSDVRVIAVALA